MKMASSTTISREEAVEVRKEMKNIKNKNCYRRMEALALLGEGKTPKEVSEITKYNEKYVRMLRCKYVKEGLEPFKEDGRKGGNNRLMDAEESKAFLSQFEEKARAGQVITVEEIAEELDKITGKKRASKSTVYYFLKSNGWRKIMPRSKHPKKASDEAIEASKKLTLESGN